MRNLEIQTKPSNLYHFQPVHTLLKQSILTAKISSPLTASRALLTVSSTKPISTSFCTRCSSGCHSWRQIESYKCIDSIKRKLRIKVKTHVTLIVKFHIEDETFSIVKIVTDTQAYDCSIEVPLLYPLFWCKFSFLMLTCCPMFSFRGIYMIFTLLPLNAKVLFLGRLRTWNKVFFFFL